jgi:TonB family protein
VQPAADFLTLTRTANWLRRPTWRDDEPRPCLLPESMALKEVVHVGFSADEAPEPELADAPFLVEFAEQERLDPGRAEIPPDVPLASPRTKPIPGSLGSLGAHLFILFLILFPGITPAETPALVPIQLVLEAPPPPPKAPAPPKPETVKPTGPIASESMGDPNAKEGAAPTSPKEPVAAAPKPAPEPKLIPPPPPPKPIPPREEIAALVPPRINPPPSPLQHRPNPAPRRPPEEERPPAHAGRIPGPAASRDEYLAYLVKLTRQHFDILPLSFLDGRSGETSLMVRIMADGTIARITIAQGSGYPDIDRRVAEMVGAVGRFPPLPQWYQGDAMDLIFKLRFPEGLEER